MRQRQFVLGPLSTKNLAWRVPACLSLLLLQVEVAFEKSRGAGIPLLSHQLWDSTSMTLGVLAKCMGRGAWKRRVSHSPGPSLEITCEDGHVVEAAVQLAEQDGQEAVCCQHAGISCALVIHHHILWFCGIHLGGHKGKSQVAWKSKVPEDRGRGLPSPFTPTPSASA